MNLTKVIDAKKPKKNEILDYIVDLTSAQSLFLKKTLAKSNDVARTIGIYTDYIDTMDWGLEMGDKAFLVKVICGNKH